MTMQVFDNAVASLGEDADLRAVKNVKRYLLRGIGVHHGGLIPLVKELVEILFQESLVKVLFATETFAMGLNMPARAVVFTAFTKSDGQCVRALTSGEYIQMSGRAGRRGKDDRGYAIMLVEDASSFTPDIAKAMLRGAPMPLVSRFKLSYYTLLNLTKRTEGGLDHMEFLIGNSFQSFQHARAIPGWQKRLEVVNARLAEHETNGAPALLHLTFLLCECCTVLLAPIATIKKKLENCMEILNCRFKLQFNKIACMCFRSRASLHVP
jgi:ATP-dependent RNA helicase DOB1